MLKKLHSSPNKYSVRTLLVWLWQTSQSLRLQAGLNALTGCLGVGLDFAFIWTTKMAIDIATNRISASLTTAAAGLIAIITAQMALGLLSRWIRALLGVKAQNRMQQRIFTRLLGSEWNGLEQRHSGDILNRLERDVTDVVNTLTETAPSVLSVSLRLVGAFFFLYSMDSLLACLTILILPAFLLLSRLYVKKMRVLTREVRNTDSRIQSILQESIQHHMVIKTLERDETMTGRLEDVQAHLRRRIKTRTLFSSFSSLMLNAGFATCYLVTFLWGVSRLQEGTITYGMMMAFIQLVGQIQGPFRDLTRFIPVLINACTASERLMELEEIPEESKGEPIRFDHTAGIRIDNISYAYDKNRRWVLKDFSYHFPPGSSTAILGETGAGKTTLIRLILALMKPDAGSITFYDGTREATGSPQTRCNLVYVPQGNTLFSGTIRDNLLMGNPEADENDMRQALRQACADFVLSLPEGLDTRCGEMGNGLSEGQAQRIAIARALLRRGSILLLDEATSALDLETEQQLLKNLTQNQLKNKTLLFITHRRAVVEYCSQVLHLKKQRA